jgi:hypothetical protein
LKTTIVRVVYHNPRGGFFSKNFEVTDKTLDEVEMLLNINTCQDPDIVAIRAPGKIVYVGNPV